VADIVGACNLELGACEDISLQWLNLAIILMQFNFDFFFDLKYHFTFMSIAVGTISTAFFSTIASNLRVAELDVADSGTG